MRLKSVWLSWSLHALNAIWIFRIFYLAFNNQHVAVNYLADETVLIAIFSCIAFYMWRWKSISTQLDGRVFDSSIALGAAIRQVTEKMFDGFWYLIKPIPTDKILREHAALILERKHLVQILSNLDLMRLMAGIKGFIFYHLICSLSCAIGLFFGDSLNYGSNLKNTLLFIPLFMCILVNLLVYSTSILLFLLLNVKNRDL